MSLYDETNPQHLSYLARHKARSRQMIIKNGGDLLDYYWRIGCARLKVKLGLALNHPTPEPVDNDGELPLRIR